MKSQYNVIITENLVRNRFLDGDTTPTCIPEKTNINGVLVHKDQLQGNFPASWTGDWAVLYKASESLKNVYKPAEVDSMNVILVSNQFVPVVGALGTWESEVELFEEAGYKEYQFYSYTYAVADEVKG